MHSVYTSSYIFTKHTSLLDTGKKKNIFCTRKFLQGLLDDINEQDTCFVDCKHKQMMKSGAPPDKFGVLFRMFIYRIPWFHKQN